MLSSVSIGINPLYYTVIGSKRISMGDAQKHFKLV